MDICITMPTELIKTKMQLYPEMSKKGVRFTILDTVKKQGYRGECFFLRSRSLHRVIYPSLFLDTENGCPIFGKEVLR